MTTLTVCNRIESGTSEKVKLNSINFKSSVQNLKDGISKKIKRPVSDFGEYWIFSILLIEKWTGIAYIVEKRIDIFIFPQIFKYPSENLNHSDQLTNIVDGKIGVNSIYNRPPAPKPNCHMHQHDQLNS